MEYFILFVILLNLALWGLMLFRFKKLFTTDDVIEKTKKKLNSMLRDLDAASERNVRIIDDRLSKLDSLLKETDKKIMLLDNINSRNEALEEFNKKVNEIHSIVNQAKNTDFNSLSKNDAKSVPSGENPPFMELEPARFYVEENEESSFPEEDGDNELKKNILALFDVGYTTEDIAKELNCSVTEVEFVLTLENRL